MNSARVQMLRTHGGMILRTEYHRAPKDLNTSGHRRPIEWEDHFAPTRPFLETGEEGPLFIKRVYSPLHLARLRRENPELPPVVLFPPFGCNGNIYRLTSKGRVLAMDTHESFANFLAVQGRDVYIVHPSYCDSIYRRYVEQFPGVPYGFGGETNFTMLLERDVPAAIAYVRYVTGANMVDWIGHSMGGMLMYAYLAANPKVPVRRVVAIGSPAAFDDSLAHQIARLNIVIGRVLGSLERGPIGLASNAVAPASWILGKLAPLSRRFVPLLNYILNIDNTDPRVFSALLRKVIENPGAALTQSFIHWISGGAFGYADAMAGIRTPFLLVSGSKDRVASDNGVRAAERVMSGAPVRRLHLDGYGHVDLLVGKKAMVDVWGPTAEFLA